MRSDSENDRKRNKVIALIVTVIFHGLLLLCFVFMGLTYQVPPPPEYGIEVDMGGGGGSTRSDIIAVSTPRPSTEDISVQDNEVTASVNAVKNPTVQPKPTPTNTTTEQPQVVETPTVNPNALFRRSNNQGGISGGSSSGTGGGTGEGEGSGMGNSGGDFYLSGRPVVTKAFPQSKNNLEGVVKVDFRADRSGNVIYAKAGGRGTTINDPQIWEECEKAALKSKFKAKPDADAEERGTITYRFVVQ